MLIKFESTAYLDGYADLSGTELETFLKILAKIRPTSREYLEKTYEVARDAFKPSVTVVTEPVEIISREKFQDLRNAFDLGRRHVRATLVAPLLANPEVRAHDEALFAALEEHGVIYSSERKTAYVFGGTDVDVTIAGTGYQEKPYTVLVRADGTYNKKYE